MRLCAIELENFKGISTRQRLELSPITLLFGPNSVGKSTVLQALHYLREILERQNVNPDKTVAGGGIDLGGFQNMVHNHELSRSIRIKVEMDLTGVYDIEHLKYNFYGRYTGEDDFNELFHTRYLIGDLYILEHKSVENIGIEVEISWSVLLEKPYTEKYTVFMNKEKIASIHSPPQKGRAQLGEINFFHPLISVIEEPDYDELANNEEELEDEIVIAETPQETELGKELQAFSLQMASSITTDTFNIDDGIWYTVGVSTEFDALPEIREMLKLELIDDSSIADKDEFLAEMELAPYHKSIQEKLEDNYDSRRLSLTRLLDELMLGPARIALDYLESMTYLGPIRAIPKRNYQPKLSPDSSRWADGLAAWDLLYAGSNDKLINQVNSWLFDENRLNTGYQLEKSGNKIIPVPGHFHQLFERGLDEDDLGVLQELYNNLPTAKKIALRDFHKGVLVEPIEVGVGISQMLPIIVACLKSGDGLRIIEQPELHIHPAHQVSLGDLFIEIVQSEDNPENPPTSLLIETHSEHIILRLLRRIREKFENELPENTIGLDPSDVSVYYVQDTAKGVNFKKLRIDEEGEFIDRWPKGFFDERAAELF